MDGEADRTSASRADFIGKLQSVKRNSKNGNLVAAGVACEKPAAAPTENERALVAQAAASANAVCGKRAKKRKGAVRGAAVGQHVIASTSIIHCEQCAGIMSNLRSGMT